MTTLRLTALDGLPEIETGTPLAPLLIKALGHQELALETGDILAVCQKIVSKAQGRFVDLAAVEPSSKAETLAAQCGKDARIVQLVLDESNEVVRCAPGVLIVRHRLGFVSANAGIDRSNVPGSDTQVLLLPRDPDDAATRLRNELRTISGTDCAVLINDSFGRPWRLGVTGICLGAAGVRTLRDLRGTADRQGRAFEHTEVAIGDELAAAASLVMGQADDSRPAVLIRGASSDWFGDGSGRDLQRPATADLFR